MSKYVATYAATVALVGIAWVLNIVALTDCDFASPYKCEVIHAVGLAPPAALVTVWFTSDK